METKIFLKKNQLKPRNGTNVFDVVTCGSHPKYPAS